ncbi:hypothetical protein IT409_02555 [Candidatus Falkowbacteria bacterium]|nr:hypothetical protein [Candidatus Falkowbacteria bacterium]
MTLQELHLKFTHAHTQFIINAPSSQTHWSEFYVNSLIEDDLKITPSELGSLLREADAAYHNLPEQESYTLFMSEYIHQQTK